MKILSAAQTREADLATLSAQNLESADLMERAALACTQHLLELIREQTTNIFVICGKGNNGGDGLAIARLLDAAYSGAKKIIVFIAEHTASASKEFTINLQRLQLTERIKIISVSDDVSVLQEQLHDQKDKGIIIDALFGYGLNKAIEGVAAKIIDEINNSGMPVISIDLPSGLFPDSKTKGVNSAVVRASLTLTFQHPKLAFMMAENAGFCSDFVVVDIGLDEKFIEAQKPNYHFTEKKEIAPLLQKRGKFAHKGHFGHALLVAGSYGKMGAAVMAARACLRSGAGLLTTHIPKCGVEIMQASLPEAMASSGSEEHFVESLPFTGNYNAIGIGPGLGTDEQTGNVLKLLIQNFPGPIVIDADGLNLLAQNKTWLGFIPPHTIITPHPKEFDRLAGAHTSDFDRLESAIQLSTRYKIIIVLKGAHTALIVPSGQVYFNSSGNPAMAKGGSGDVLCGMITGLLARGYNEFHAALIGVYLHGLAGDLAASSLGPESVLAGEITEHIPRAFSVFKEV